MPITDINQISHIDIELSSHCNLHCPQCARFDQQGYMNKYLEPAHLLPNPILDNLEFDKLRNLTNITIEGDHGDPVMNPHLDRFIRSLPAHLMVDMYTNGSLRSVAWWRQLATSRQNLQVIFSIDGLEDTNAVYRIGSDYAKIMDNVSAFITAGGHAVWKMIVFRHNEHQIDQARQRSIDLGFKNFWHSASNRNFYNDRSWPIMVEGQSRGTLEMSSKLTQPKLKTQQRSLHRLHEFKPVKCKWATDQKIYIDFMGNVIPCCMTSGLMWRQDITGQLWQKIVGDTSSINLYRQTLSQILQSDFYQTRLKRSLESAYEIHHTCLGTCA